MNNFCEFWKYKSFHIFQKLLKTIQNYQKTTKNYQTTIKKLSKIFKKYVKSKKPKHGP